MLNSIDFERSMAGFTAILGAKTFSQQERTLSCTTFLWGWVSQVGSICLDAVGL